MTRLHGLLALGLIALQALPIVAAVMEESMVSHMLVQLPFLLLLGVVIVKSGMVVRVFRFDRKGFICAAIVSNATVYWMLPISLDTAIESNLGRFAKLVSVPVAGVALQVAWQRLPVLFRGVLALELWAMLLRGGWLYVVSDVQLCSYYLQSEQVRVGWVLCMLGLALAVSALLWLIFGRPLGRGAPKACVGLL